MSRRRVLPCACGLPVAANPLDPVPGVRAHRATDAHRRWSEEQWRALTPDETAGPLTVAMLRELGLAPREEGVA